MKLWLFHHLKTLYSLDVVKGFFHNKSSSSSFVYQDINLFEQIRSLVRFKVLNISPIRPSWDDTLIPIAIYTQQCQYNDIVHGLCNDMHALCMKSM